MVLCLIMPFYISVHNVSGIWHSPWWHEWALFRSMSLLWIFKRGSALMAHNIHFRGHYSSVAQDTSGPVTLKTTNSSPKHLFPQWGKKGKFLLFKMVVHNLSMEHKRVCELQKMDGGSHAHLNKKVFKPSSRSSSQGSMILKTGRELGLVNIMDRQESLKAPREKAIMQSRTRTSNLHRVSQLPKTKNTCRGPDCFLKSSPRRHDGFWYFDC